jgi:hypothetical protein
MKSSLASSQENGSENSKSRNGKRIETSSGGSVNYLNLFQLNPLLMHAANASPFNIPAKEQTSPNNNNISASDNKPIEDATSSDKNELYETVLEQKMLNDTLDMMQSIENSLNVNNYENFNGSCENLNEEFLTSLTDQNLIQFKVQIPNLLPKMHFVCETGSRILFKTIDWMRDMQVFQYFTQDIQSEVLKATWIELLCIGIAQICSSSSQSHLKALIISTLVNYVKSLLILSEKNDEKSVKVRKIKKMLSNIMLLNKFIDNFIALELDNCEYAHIRMMSYFNPNKVYLTDMKLSNMQEKINENFKKTSSVDRLICVHQSLGILQGLDGKIVEKLFFNILVDFIRIDNVIPYIVNLNTNSEQKFDFKHEKDFEFDENSPSINSDDQRYYNSFSDGCDERN